MFYKNIREVGYFFADGKLVYLVEANGARKFLIDHTLDELADRHLDPTHFFRINRTYVVHIEAIEEIQPHPNQRLLLKLKGGEGHDFIVSREKNTPVQVLVKLLIRIFLGLHK